MTTAVLETPRIRQWLDATMEALDRGIWRRPEGLVYSGMDELLHRHGRAFEWVAGDLPDDVPAGKLGDCYQNAGRLMGARYRYVEGYACADGGIPVPHAWLVDEDDKVVDPTWQSFGFGGGREYFGVVVPNLLFHQTVLRRKVWGILDDPELYTRTWEEE